MECCSPLTTLPRSPEQRAAMLLPRPLCVGRALRWRRKRRSAPFLVITCSNVINGFSGLALGLRVRNPFHQLICYLSPGISCCLRLPSPFLSPSFFFPTSCFSSEMCCSSFLSSSSPHPEVFERSETDLKCSGAYATQPGSNIFGRDCKECNDTAFKKNYTDHYF